MKLSRLFLKWRPEVDFVVEHLGIGNSNKVLSINIAMHLCQKC